MSFHKTIGAFCREERRFIIMKKRYYLLIILGLIILNFNIVKVSASGKEQLNQTSINLVTGKQRDYTYLKVINATGYPKYKTSNKKVASIDSKGLVKAVGVGKCTITVKVKSHKYKCKVKVTKALSEKQLKKKISASATIKDGYIFYKVSNKLNKPLKVTIYTSQCDNDGNINDWFFGITIPAKSTQKWYEQASSDVVAYKIKKIECEYTCKISQSIVGELDWGEAVISIPQKKAGIKIENVHKETAKGLFGEQEYLYIDGYVYNNTPFDLSTNMFECGTCNIVFYKNDRIVHVEKIDYNVGGNEEQNNQFKDRMLIISNWDYDYDRYEVIYNDGYYRLNY